MQAVILAAGMGTRIRSVHTIPKAFIEVDRKVLIKHSLDKLKNFVDRVIIVTGYMNDLFGERIGNFYRGMKITYVYNKDFATTGSGGSLYCAKDAIGSDNIIVLESDLLYERRALNEIFSNPEKNIILTSDLSGSGDEVFIKTDENKNLVSLGKGIQRTSEEFVGISKLSSEFLKVFFDECEKSKHYEEIIAKISSKIPVKCQYIKNLIWTEIDNENDYNRAIAIIYPKIKNSIKRLVENYGFLRVIEAHNGISALIGSQAKVGNNEFDAMWSSSFADSASRGKPDAEIVSFETRLSHINQILDATEKPIIMDGDTGRDPANFEFMVRKLESLGVSSIIIEDKVFPKRNSLSADANQILEDPIVFANKIRRGKQVLMTNDFMIIARIESLIAGFGVDDAIKRAKAYLLAGADGIMIHSKEKDPSKIFEFGKRYNELSMELGFRKPLVCVPTAYNHVTEEELKAAGFNIVIYANHMMRASYKAMENVCETILSNSRCLEAEPVCASVKQIFEKVGFEEIKQKDKA